MLSAAAIPARSDGYSIIHLASRELLVRYVLGTDGRTPIIDLRKTLSGRGAWLHDDPACYELATRRRAFARALRASKT